MGEGRGRFVNMVPISPKCRQQLYSPHGDGVGGGGAACLGSLLEYHLFSPFEVMYARMFATDGFHFRCSCIDIWRPPFCQAPKK